MNKVRIFLIVSLAAVVVLWAVAAKSGANEGPPERVIVYVTSQGLFYDSIVGPPLPPFGPFQKLEMAGPTGLQTEFGPRDVGYKGGRWWVDVNGNGFMDMQDAYFSCPLLGRGRINP